MLRCPPRAPNTCRRQKKKDARATRGRLCRLKSIAESGRLLLRNPRGLRQRVRLVDALPREAPVLAGLAAEVPVPGRLLVDRPQQVQVLDDPARRERER